MYLLEIQPYAQQHNSYQYILVVIDSNCRYLWSELIKSKKADIVTEAFQNVLKHADNGIELYNHNFSEMMRIHNISNYSNLPPKNLQLLNV